MENTEKIMEPVDVEQEKVEETVAEVVGEAVECEIELRPLVATDMGAICKIIAAIGIRQFKDSFNIKGLDLENLSFNQDERDEENKKKAIENALEMFGIGVAVDLAGIIMANFPKAETEIQMFLASLTGMKLVEVQNMGIADYGELIMRVVMKEEFKDFFKRVMKLFNR